MKQVKKSYGNYKLLSNKLIKKIVGCTFNSVSPPDDKTQHTIMNVK
jgi:hypothetical protein